ncbi:MAG TPA: helix-turn-helix domain-containing protein [Verrucomicrobiae bacterium]|nr:helix-turn-helix domain-containing protein [Verrucomicrobiae bacterium]
MKAALPLFARQGFARTTTRQLADAAGISEALLYKHFPSKESLYAEIQAYGCQGSDPGLRKLVGLESSTSTLVYIIYYVVRANIIGRPCETMHPETRHRMILNSCLEDGTFTRFLFQNRFAENLSRIVDCMKAAERAGDLVLSPVTEANRILFSHHLAGMIATMQLPEVKVIEYGASPEELVNQAVWFALRGLGLSESAMAKYYNPAALLQFFCDD